MVTQYDGPSTMRSDGIPLATSSSSILWTGWVWGKRVNPRARKTGTRNGFKHTGGGRAMDALGVLRAVLVQRREVVPANNGLRYQAAARSPRAPHFFHTRPASACPC